jgi:hypothetical protein
MGRVSELLFAIDFINGENEKKKNLTQEYKALHRFCKLLLTTQKRAAFMHRINK